MLIIADTNEKATSQRTISELRACFKEIVIANLQFGDLNAILEDGKILAVERKTVHDFLSSIADGRLFSQVEKMSQADYCCIVVEGVLSFNEKDMAVADGEETNWRGASVRGAIFAVNWSACPIIFIPKGAYAVVVDEMIDFVSKPEEHWQFNHQRIITFPPVDDATNVLAAFPNIGLKRATSLLKFAGTNGKNGTLARAIAWATVLNIPNLFDWQSKPVGWGVKIVENFRDTLGLQPNEYIDIREGLDD